MAFRRLRLLFTTQEELETRILKTYLQKSIGDIRKKLRRLYPRLESRTPKNIPLHQRELSRIVTKVLNLRMFMTEIMSIATKVRKTTEQVRAFQSEKDAGYLTTFEAKTLAYTSRMDMQIDQLITRIRGIETQVTAAPEPEPQELADADGAPQEPTTGSPDGIRQFYESLGNLETHFLNLLILRKESMGWLQTKDRLKLPTPQDKEGAKTK